MLRLPPVLLSCVLLLVSGLTSALSWAGTWHNDEVQALIDDNNEPAGVVFEMISWDERTWQWAAPWISHLRGQLRAKYPGLDVVVVSHGGEQFQLTKDKINDQPEAIAQLASLSEDGVNVHICGIHSYWNNVPEDAYLDFVDIAASGPAQIRDYMNVGYRRIVLERPE